MSFELDCYIGAETGNAILVSVPDLDLDVWIPLSQVEEIHKHKAGGATIVMTDWIARQKGLL